MRDHVIIEKNYVAMMEALQIFSGNVRTQIAEMDALAANAKNVLEEEDAAVGPICTDIAKCTSIYSALITRAMKIHSMLEKDLMDAKKDGDFDAAD